MTSSSDPVELAYILCMTEQEAMAAKSYLKGVGATDVTCAAATDMSVHRVEIEAGNPKRVLFPSEWHQMGDFWVVTGVWK